MQRTATDISKINYTGSPEGVISANPGSLSQDPVSGNIYQKILGTGNTGWSSPINHQMIYYMSDPIDFTTLGAVEIFTCSATGIFLPITLITVMDTLTNFISGAVGDIGFNGPTYDNVYSGWQELVNTQGSFYYQAASAPSIIVPSGSVIKLNITVPEVADVAVGRIGFLGITI